MNGSPRLFERRTKIYREPRLTSERGDHPLGADSTPAEGAISAAGGASVDAAVRANVLMQLENLRSYPLVERKRRSGELKLFGWFYDIRRAKIEQWDAERGAFVPVGRGLPESDPESSRDRTPGEPAPTLA